MLPFFDHLQEATVLKRFLDEFQKNPGRTILALVVVLGLTGAGVSSVFGETDSTTKDLSQLPVEAAQFGADGTLEKLPEPKLANEMLRNSLERDERRHQLVLEQLSARDSDAPVTEREIQLLNDSGKVTYR